MVEVLVDELQYRQRTLFLLYCHSAALTSLAAFDRSPNAGMGKNFATPVSTLFGMYALMLAA